MFRNVVTGAAALLLSGAFVPQASAQSMAGAYLAGRHAAVRSDYSEAARYYAEALGRDSANIDLMESTVLSYVSLGQIEKAIPLARVLEPKNQSSQVARLAVIAGLAQGEDYNALLARETNSEGIGPWVDGLVKAWAHVGAGDVTSATATFDNLSEEAGMRGFVMYHKALALASVGDFEGAEVIFGEVVASGVGQTRRGLMSHAVVLAQLDRHEEALTILRTGFGEATDPELDQMIASLEAKTPLPFSLVRDAKSGIAEVFFTFAIVLKNENARDYYVLLYSRIARYLRPSHVDALLLTAGLLESLGQSQLAIEEYGDVPEDDPAFHVAKLGRVDVLRRSGQEDQAVEVLEQLARSHDDLAVVHSTLGDVLRAQDDFPAAIAAYDRAIERATNTERVRWVLYYSRGIAFERSGDEAASEADFRAALAINPEQPQVLNYLGYSMVEQNRNLDEALDMIERAVAASPQSGYIVDSLGWVLYRLGRYNEAVAHMERAVELLAVDPVVNDHLGDVYWAVGRQREAEFQWSRALSFIDEGDATDEADPDRIRSKLDVGLDTVLEDEGAPPLKVSNDI